MNLRLLFVLAASCAFAVGCGATCGPDNCAGCCDASGVCQAAAAQHCGVDGAACSTCIASEQCILGACKFAGSGSGNGTHSSSSGSSSSVGSGASTGSTTSGTNTSTTGTTSTGTTTTGTTSTASTTTGTTSTGTTTGGSDTTPPVLQSIAVSPTTVDVTNGPQSFQLTLHITDDRSGLAQNFSFTLEFESPSGTHRIYASLSDQNRTSGTALDGIYAVTFTVPMYAEAGTWSLSGLQFQDNVGNSVSYDSSQLPSLGTWQVSVTSPHADTTAPVLRSVTVSQNQVDVSNAPANVQLTMRITDDFSGFATNYSTTVALCSPGSQEVYSSLHDGDRVTGTSTDGDYQITFRIPRYEVTGAWHLCELDLVDEAGNEQSYDASSLAAAGLAVVVQVTSSVTDVTAPILQSATAQPNSVNTANGDATVTLSLHITDDLSGLATNFSFTESYVSPSGNNSIYFSLYDGDRTSGTANDGVYAIDVTVPQFSESGVWIMNGVNFQDDVGNSVSYDASTLQAQGLSAAFTVQ